jgi:hypothetical protein
MHKSSTDSLAIAIGHIAEEIEEPDPAALAFDDEPLDNLLHSLPGPGPTPASPFAASATALTAIRQAADEVHDTAQALRLAAAVFADGGAVPASALEEFVTLLRPIIPILPRAIVVDHGLAYESILEPCFRIAATGGHQSLMEISGMLLYRWYESGARYAPARRIITELLVRARQRRDLLEAAVLTNNLGYEYLLEADCPRAEPWFVRAGALFAASGYPSEVANAAANRLLCEYAMDPDSSRERCEGQARELLAILNHDWRRRKLLILLARIEERRGHFEAALALAEEAVKASEGVASQHRLEDQAYRDALAAKCSAQDSVLSASSSHFKFHGSGW